MTTIRVTLTDELCVCADPAIEVRSRAAFYDMARKLDELGHGEATLQAQDERGRDTISVSPISVAAKWTVRETEKMGPHLFRWRPFPGLPGGQK